MTEFCKKGITSVAELDWAKAEAAVNGEFVPFLEKEGITLSIYDSPYYHQSS